MNTRILLSGIFSTRAAAQRAAAYIKVEVIRQYTDLPVIYDHQKEGTDIPKVGARFAQSVKSYGADAVILFPFGGAVIEKEWIKACQGEGLIVLVSEHMTSKEFFEGESGFIANLAPDKIYTITAENEVSNFIVPGNKAEFVQKYRQLLEKILGAGNFTLYAPGFHCPRW